MPLKVNLLKLILSTGIVSRSKVTISLSRSNVVVNVSDPWFWGLNALILALALIALTTALNTLVQVSLFSPR